MHAAQPDGQTDIRTCRDASSQLKTKMAGCPFYCTFHFLGLTSVGDAVPQSAQAGGRELVQGVPAHFMSGM